MKPFPDLRSQILIVPGFLEAAECASLRRELDEQVVEKSLPATPRQPPTLEPRFWAGEIVDTPTLLRALRSDGVGRLLLDRYGDPSDQRAVLGLREDEVAQRAWSPPAANILSLAAADLDFFPLVAASFPPQDGSLVFTELADRLSEGVLEADGAAYARRDPLSEAEALALRWFNVRVLEELVFPATIRKDNRLLRDGVSPEALVARLEGMGKEGSPLALLALLRDRHPELANALERGPRSARLAALRQLVQALPVQLTLLGAFREQALALLERRADANSSRFDSLRSRATGLALRATGSYPRCRAVHAMLHLFHPAEVLPPNEPGVATNLRDAQTLEVPGLQPRLRDLVRRLATDHVDPWFGIRTRLALERAQVLKYKEGGHYVVHADSEGPAFGGEGRDVSVLLYLSRATDFSGGELAFPELNFRIAPEEGMAVSFPSDRRFLHAARPVTRGTRYAIVAWLTSVP